MVGREGEKKKEREQEEREEMGVIWTWKPSWILPADSFFFLTLLAMLRRSVLGLRHCLILWTVSLHPQLHPFPSTSPTPHPPLATWDIILPPPSPQNVPECWLLCSHSPPPSEVWQTEKGKYFTAINSTWKIIWKTHHPTHELHVCPFFPFHILSFLILYVTHSFHACLHTFRPKHHTWGKITKYTTVIEFHGIMAAASDEVTVVWTSVVF